MPVRVENIAIVVDPLLPEAPLCEAARRFGEDPSLFALPVVFEDAVIGLLSRAQLGDRLITAADPSQMAALMDLPVTRLMDRHPATVERGAPAAYIAQASLDQRTQTLRHGAVLVNDGCYGGLISPEAISQAVTEENTARAKAMRASQTQVAEARAALDRQQSRHADFLAILAHELRTPLTGILGVADLLCDARLKGEARHYARTLSQSGRFLERLLTDLLDLSRLDTGRLPIAPEPVDLRSFAHEIKHLWESQIDAEKVQLKVSLADELANQVNADPLRLRQILFNLVSNAIKFTAAGQIRVTFSTASHIHGGLALIMEVADTGIGIADEDKARLFNAWEQVRVSDARLKGGAGLGLSVAQGLVKKMGGRIELSDNPGGGSVFTVTCPVGVCEVSGASRPQSPPRKTLDVALGRLLVAEDHAANRLVLERALSAAGWQVDMVHNGEQALRRAGERAYQAILLDIHLPKMKGDVVAHELRAGQGPNSAVPLISLSADISAKQRDASKAAGFDAFVDKPIHPRELVATLVDTLMAAPNRRFHGRLEAVAS